MADAPDWRDEAELPEIRRNNVKEIMKTLERHRPSIDEEGSLEHQRTAQGFEEKAHATATGLAGYQRFINSKLKSIEAAQQEEVYQKIKSMKEIYLPELNETHQKIVTKLQQHNPLPQQPVPDQIEKLKVFKSMLERIIAFLQVSKSAIVPNYKEKLGLYEKQIINYVHTTRCRKAVALQQESLPPPHMHSPQQPQSQFAQLPSQNNVPIFISIPSNSASTSRKPPVPANGKSQTSIANSMPSNSVSDSSKTPISGLGMQSQNDGDLTHGRRISGSKRKR